MDAIALSDKSVKEYLNKSGQRPLAILFYGQGCVSCDAVEQVLSELTDESYKQKLTLAKMELAANPLTARQFLIESIPYVLFVSGDRRDGYLGSDGDPAQWSKRKLASFFKRNLAK